MVVAALVIAGFFGFSAALGLLLAALGPGGFRNNVASALGLFVGAPAMLGLAGVVLGLVFVALEWLGRAIGG